MNFEPTTEQRMVADEFARFLDGQSSIARVRAALPSGFDGELWRAMAEMGTFGLRVSEAAGGLGLGILDATLVMEQVGRTLASGPIAEAIVAAAILDKLGAADGGQRLAACLDGTQIFSIALQDAAEAPEQIVAGGAVADHILVLDGDVVFVVRPDKTAPPRNLASQPLAMVALTQNREELASGPHARAVFLAAVEEWKLLCAAALQGLGGEALRLAAAYATERLQFGQPIGTYQAISHPLAALSVDNEGARFLIWRAIRELADGADTAGAMVALAAWWCARTAGKIGSQAVQTFGGYGLALEYDIHLFTLRAKAWTLILGDPEEQLVLAGDRLWGGAATPLPEAGGIDIEFEIGAEAEAMGDELRAFFEKTLPPDLRAKALYSLSGFDAGFHKAVAGTGLLFPAWSKAYGGREANPYAALAVAAVWDEYGWTTAAIALTNQVAHILMKFGSPEAKRDVLSRVVSGDATCSPGLFRAAFRLRCLRRQAACQA